MVPGEHIRAIYLITSILIYSLAIYITPEEITVVQKVAISLGFKEKSALVVSVAVVHM